MFKGPPEVLKSLREDLKKIDTLAPHILVDMLAVLRARQLGYISDKEILYAIENSYLPNYVIESFPYDVLK